MLASPSGCHKFQLVKASTPSSDDLFPQVQSPILGSAKTFFFKNNCFEKYVFVSLLLTFPGRTCYISVIVFFEGRRLKSR